MQPERIVSLRQSDSELGHDRRGVEMVAYVGVLIVKFGRSLEVTSMDGIDKVGGEARRIRCCDQNGKKTRGKRSGA